MNWVIPHLWAAVNIRIAAVTVSSLRTVLALVLVQVDLAATVVFTAIMHELLGISC